MEIAMDMSMDLDMDRDMKLKNEQGHGHGYGHEIGHGKIEYWNAPFPFSLLSSSGINILTLWPIRYS
jgi:hypothetical protein